LVCDDKGVVWLVDPIKNMLTSYDHGHISRVPIPDAVHLAPAQSIGLDRDGSILVSFKESGLWRFDETWTQIQDHNLPIDDPLAIVRDSDKRVWLGYANSLIVTRDESGFHPMTPRQGGDLGNVLTFSSSAGKFWAAGTNGLAYLDSGSFRHVFLRRDGILRGVSGVVEDHSGNLWLNGSTGIIRVSAEELQKLSPEQAFVDYELFDDRQGAMGSATQMKPTPSAVADKDGRLWFSTSGQVLSIDPGNFVLRQSMPSLSIQRVTVNGAPIADREHRISGITVGSSKMKELEIDYAGIDLAAPEKVAYKYLLEGEEKEWHDVGARRQAFYSHLKPGSYRFHILAMNGTDRGTELGAPLLISVTPAFYQTPGFIVALVLLIGVLLYIGYLLRVRYLTSSLKKRLKERAEERLRIARELHDTLLQSIHGLMLRFHFATEGLPESEPARGPLLFALSRADEVFVEARKRIEYLRDEVPDEPGIAQKIAKIAEELEIQNALSFRVVEEGQRQFLTDNVEMELCRIAREALINTRNHAKASSAEVVIAYGSSELLMKCCDTGVGIPATVLSDGSRLGHWGLVGMRERATSINGTLQLWSSPETGTQIEVRVPAKRAYRYPRGRIAWFEEWLEFRRTATGKDLQS
jgi:signal transduction histidine kinase